MSSTMDSDSNLNLNLFTKSNPSDMSDLDWEKYLENVNKTRTYVESIFATIHPAIYCMGHLYRRTMSSDEKEITINTAFIEHGMPKDVTDAISWLVSNPHKYEYFRYRGINI